MFHTTTHLPTSPAEGLRGYGLSGIDLGHRNRVRETTAERDLQLRQVEVRGLVNNLRQMVGHALVSAGSGIAGRHAVEPAISIRTRASMP